jgi:hypothetical protein
MCLIERKGLSVLSKNQSKSMKKIYKYLGLFLCCVILTSCEGEIVTEGIEGTTICNFSDIEVSASDNVVIASATDPVIWEGSYTDTSVKISFTETLNNDGASETLNFVFNKVENCLQIDRGYEFYNGGASDISAITEVSILDTKIKDWEIDEKFSGQIIYRDHHDKLIKELNFWIVFSTDDYIIENTEYAYFADCFADKLPINIDLDNDSITDYTILSEEVVDFANNPNFVFYTIKLVSTDESINEILSPKGVSIPFPVIFEPPFSSDNTRSYAANKFNSVDVRNALDVFYEFETPYENYNFFLNNNLTNKKEFDNNIDDYYAVKLIRNNENFYGWIKIEFDAINCKIAVLDTFLSPNTDEHFNVD